MGLSIDEQADETQRGALQMIFGGQVGGFPAEFAEFSSSGKCEVSSLLPLSSR